VHRVAQSTTTRRRVLGRVVPAVLGIGVAVVLAGCGAGQITQTGTQSPAVNGASGNVGPIALRDVQLAAPPNPQGVYQPGSSAKLIVTIVNTGLVSDALVQVTTPAATSVLINGSARGSGPLPGNFAVASGQDRDDATSVVVGPPSSTPSGPSSAAPTTAGSSSAVPPALAPGKVSIVLSGIKSVNGGPLRAGMTIPVTFYFLHAGQVTVAAVPIGAPADATAVLNPSSNG
jgi:copper(I)-binding protein